MVFSNFSKSQSFFFHHDRPETRETRDQRDQKPDTPDKNEFFQNQELGFEKSRFRYINYLIDMYWFDTSSYSWFFQIFQNFNPFIFFTTDQRPERPETRDQRPENVLK